MFSLNLKKHKIYINLVGDACINEIMTSNGSCEWHVAHNWWAYQVLGSNILYLLQEMTWSYELHVLTKFGTWQTWLIHLKE